ncbi:MAG: sugar phosphate isomerase/epimerase family protein [Armatimonadota bacterium]
MQELCGQAAKILLTLTTNWRMNCTMATLQIGVMLRPEPTADEAMKKVKDLGLQNCQVSWGCGRYDMEDAKKLRDAADKHGVNIVTLWAMPSGRMVWNFVEGPSTIGLVPEATRHFRTLELQQAARIAGEIGVPSITTHLGFIPEYPGDRAYFETVHAIRSIANVCLDEGIEFWFETGQETPVTMLRTIEDVGTGNLGINLDPANLLMYGKANPIDALDVFGQHVRGVHAKDGEYPTDGTNLGSEKPMGEGRVNFPELVPKLKECGYEGVLAIEREISGPKQIEDIKRAIKILRPLC